MEKNIWYNDLRNYTARMGILRRKHMRSIWYTEISKQEVDMEGRVICQEY